MAASFGASASATGNDTAPTVAKPTGTVDGDYLLWYIQVEYAAPTITPPSGFTQIATLTTALGSLTRLYGKAAS